MTSRRPYWCPKTMKRRPWWCPNPILWELNSFLMQTLSFVPINLHRCWPREWKHSIVGTCREFTGTCFNFYSHWEPARASAPCALGTCAFKFQRICGFAGELVVHIFLSFVYIDLFSCCLSLFSLKRTHQTPSLSPHPPPRSDGTLWRRSSRSLWTGSLSGEKNSKERPVHRL